MQARNHHIAEFKKAAEDFVLKLQPRQGGATVVGLYGNLGAGKTTFVQAAAKALGITNHIVSPTFLIMRTYPLLDLSPLSSGENESGWASLTHIDAYRLESSAELKALRFEELLKDRSGLILIEWADKVADILPKDHMKLFFEFVDDKTRSICFP